MQKIKVFKVEEKNIEKFLKGFESKKETIEDSFKKIAKEPNDLLNKIKIKNKIPQKNLLSTIIFKKMMECLDNLSGTDLFFKIFKKDILKTEGNNFNKLIDKEFSKMRQKEQI